LVIPIKSMFRDRIHMWEPNHQRKVWQDLSTRTRAIVKETVHSVGSEKRKKKTFWILENDRHNCDWQEQSPDILSWNNKWSFFFFFFFFWVGSGWVLFVDQLRDCFELEYCPHASKRRTWTRSSKQKARIHSNEWYVCFGDTSQREPCPASVRLAWHWFGEQTAIDSEGNSRFVKGTSHFRRHSVVQALELGLAKPVGYDLGREYHSDSFQIWFRHWNSGRRRWYFEHWESSHSKWECHSNGGHPILQALELQGMVQQVTLFGWEYHSDRFWQ
jgi:hypothetical protein